MGRIKPEAKYCPTCGAPLKKKTSPIVKLLVGIILIFLFVVVIMRLSENSPKTAVKNASTSNQESRVPVRQK